MRKIRSDKTSPEIILQKLLRSKGIKFRRNFRALPGKPDIAILSKKVAIFVDGEFWHGYRWQEKKSKIRANREYWVPKIEKNILRDKQNNKKLKNEGWKVLRFWQQQIIKDPLKCLEKIRKTSNVSLG
ncbi:MAG: very short patch repair endonuclease [Candidatus Omnitrophica bacterium]|nr:very short patch repair endonuclease [Candidatus Omnitrophota bacterium]